MNKTKVIYHANCTDGFGAALAVLCHLNERGRLGSAEFIPMHYKDPVPDVAGCDVYIVDFSFPRDVLLEMKEKATSIIVIDHHKTAKDELADLDFCIFDMSKSGCVLTWEYLFPHLEVPDLLLYLQDRDLWQWCLPDSREISAAIRSHPLDFALWESWMTAVGLERLRKEGVARIPS